LKFGTAWEAGGFETATCTLMLFCCALSCAVWLSGKNLWRRAIAVSSAVVEFDPSGRVSGVGAGCLVNPALQML